MFLIEKQGFHFGLIWVYLVVTPVFSMWKGSCRCNRKWWTTRFWAAGIWETVPPPAGLFFLFPAKTRWVEWCWRDMHVSGGPYLSSAVSGGERSIETPIPAFSGDCGGGTAAKVQFGTPTFKNDEVFVPRFHFWQRAPWTFEMLQFKPCDKVLKVYTLNLLNLIFKNCFI